MLSFFKKLQNQQYRYGYTNIDPFAQTHPLSSTRIQSLTADLQASPAWNKPIDPKLQERFLRVKAKLFGYVSRPRRRSANIPRAISRSMRITPAPMPITRPPIPTKPRRRPPH